MTDRQRYRDEESFFAAMDALVLPSARPGLPFVEPPVIAAPVLESVTSADIPLPVRQETLAAETFAARLAALRETYAPFLRDLTPPNPHPRPTMDVRAFAFRMEEAADRTDATRPLHGEGEWEAITIPDYRGPQGRWAGYYRTTFIPDPALFTQERVWIVFRGVDYSCRVWLNGHYLGAHEGFFAEFAFDGTDHLIPHGKNVLLVRVENDAIQMGNGSWKGGPDLDGDKVYGGTGLGWDEPVYGWQHCPPGAGLYQPVYLEGRPTTAIHDLFVRPDLDQGQCELWLEIDHAAFSKAPVRAEVSIYPRNFDGQAIEAIPVTLPDAGPRISEYRIRFTLMNCRRWTPDTPWLYTLRVRLMLENGVEDIRDVTFGMRKFHQDESATPKGTLYLNNTPIILRGSNTMGHEQRAVFEGHLDQLIDDILIAKLAHLNYFRLTQRPVQREVYAMCDALGMMLQTDLPAFAGFRKSCVEELTRQAGEMERHIRAHPSAILVSFINEPFPPTWLPEKAHRLLDREAMEDFFEIAARMVRLYNPDRVIKYVDGDYNPPTRHGLPDEHCYCAWHANHGIPLGMLHKGYLFPVKPGWKCGCGEYGAEGLDPWETMMRHYPAEWLPAGGLDAPWIPAVVHMSQTWGWHHQWFDKQATAREWIEETQRYQAWATHFQTMAFRRRADLLISTTIHLLINAWPAGWLKSLVSVDRIPLPGYFALADALTPLAVNLRTDRSAVFAGEALDVELWVLNDLQEAPAGLDLVYWVRCGDDVLFSQQVAADVPRGGAACQGSFVWQTPHVSTRTSVHVGLALCDAQGTVLHDHAITVEMFPPVDQTLLRERRVGVVGEPDGRAWRVAADFGATPQAFAAGQPWDVVIVDTPLAAAQVSAALTEYIEHGGHALFLECDAPAAWELGAHTIEVLPLAALHFVSRSTAHPVVVACHPRDFFCWYNPQVGYIDHLCKSGLAGADLAPITLTGTGIWYSERRDIPASAELCLGAGRAIFNQVIVDPYYRVEPRAAHYLAALIAQSTGCGRST